MYDAIIIGSGPAGLTAAIYLLRADKKVLILEKENIGGQITASSKVENYPGFSSISGSDLMNQMYEQVVNLKGKIQLEEALEIKDGKVKTVITDCNCYQTKTIILALGTTHRRLHLNKEEEFIGNGISFCVSCDGAFYKEKNVAVIGGGNSAVQEAINLADICKKVDLLQDLDHLTCEEGLKKKLSAKQNVEIHYQSKVTSYLGKDALEGITFLENGKEKTLKVDGVFLAVGLVPQTTFLKGLLSLEQQKYVVSHDTTTNLEGIFVAGDCREKEFRQLTTAVSDGTVAALKAIQYLNKEKSSS